MTRDQNFRLNKIKKSIPGSGIPCKSSTTESEDGNDNNVINQCGGGVGGNGVGGGVGNLNKKPALISKWKSSGVKLQVAARSENHGELII